MRTYVSNYWDHLNHFRADLPVGGEYLGIYCFGVSGRMATHPIFCENNRKKQRGGSSSPSVENGDYIRVALLPSLLVGFLHYVSYVSIKFVFVSIASNYRVHVQSYNLL